MISVNDVTGKALFISRDGHRVRGPKLTAILAAIASGDADAVTTLMADAGLSAQAGTQLYAETRRLVRRRQRELAADREKNAKSATDARNTDGRGMEPHANQHEEEA